MALLDHLYVGAEAYSGAVIKLWKHCEKSYSAAKKTDLGNAINMSYVSLCTKQDHDTAEACQGWFRLTNWAETVTPDQRTGVFMSTMPKKEW